MDGNKNLDKNFQLAREKCQKCDDADDDHDDDGDEEGKQKQKLHKIQFRIRNSNQLLLARFEFNVFYLLYANDAVFSLSLLLLLLFIVVVVHSL